MSEGVVKIEHFQAVHNLDQTHGGLKVAPKLTAAHISPNNLQRMNVRLAVQVYRILPFKFLMMLYITVRISSMHNDAKQMLISLPCISLLQQAYHTI